MQLRVSHRCAVPEIKADMLLRQPHRLPQTVYVPPSHPLQYATLRPCLARKPNRAAGRLQPCRAQVSATDPLAGLRILEWTGEPHQVQVSATRRLMVFIKSYTISSVWYCVRLFLS